MDKIRALKYFIKVAETSSFSSAAKALSLPPSSVSRRIKDLESELKVNLFHRSTRVVKLTDLGQIYFEQVREILTALENVDDFVSQRSQTPSGVLRISTMPGYGVLVLQPILEKFSEHFPDIILDIEYSNQIIDITQNEVDIAIRGTSTLPDRAVAKKLSNNEFILIASPKYIAKNGAPMVAEDLAEHRTLMYRGPNGILQWQAKIKNQWHELKTKPKYISNDGISLRKAAIDGQGIALLPKWGIKNELRSGLLQEIFLTDETVSISRVPGSGIYLLYLRPRYQILKIKAAVDFFVSELTEEDVI